MPFGCRPNAASPRSVPLAPRASLADGDAYEDYPRNVVRWGPIDAESLPVTMEMLVDFLAELGAESVAVQDAMEGTLMERQILHDAAPPENNLGGWPSARVTFLLDAERDVAGFLELVTESLGMPAAPFACEAVDLGTDWEEVARNAVESVQVAEDLWIVPPWREAPDPAATSVLINPGAAFGTGGHASTRLPLRWLARRSFPPGCSVLDVGTGSGVLAIAAIKLGAASAVANDIDPSAVENARENAALNGVADRVEVGLPGVEGARAFDLVLANILAHVHLQLKDEIAAWTKPGGTLVMSGILGHEAAGVRDAFAPAFDFVEAIVYGQWTCLVMRRR
eukprot:tig00000949_g5723.t1